MKKETILKTRDRFKLLRLTQRRTIRRSNLPRRTPMHLLRYGAHPSIHEFKDVREAHLAVADSNMREFGLEPPNPVTEEES